MAIRSEVSAEKMALYLATARRRQEEEEQARAARRELAWGTAHRAAARLKSDFAARRVLVFGSLVHDFWFSQAADIDLAAWGLPDDEYFVAVARLQDLSPEFRIDLVQMERCPPALKEAILKEGQEL